MIHTEVYYRKSDHLTRIMTALYLLEQQKILQCTYIEDEQCDVLPNSANMLEMRIDGKRIAFDLRDASALNQSKLRDYLAAVDFYFERSHIDWHTKPEFTSLAHKIHPYGFNYFCSCPGNRAIKKTVSGNIFKRSIRNITNHHLFSNVKTYEGKPSYTPGKMPTIIFMARLWNPDEVKINPKHTPEEKAYREYMRAERKKINADRIEICRELRRIYGKSFYGGILATPYAKTQCPDVLLSAGAAFKLNYLRRMKRSDICIGSAGLEKSIGWKTGEYVAASRAIVCEKMAYLLPGDFAEGKHYLAYDDAPTCLMAVERLYTQPELLCSMQAANYQYYQEYLRPDIQLINALKICGIRV